MDPAVDLSRVALIIPALNEAPGLRILLPKLKEIGVGRVIVGDNGSTDETAEIVRAHGATHVLQTKRGYGAACWAAMQRLDHGSDVVVFLDADLSDETSLLPDIAGPILRGQCDFVVSSRVRHLREPGAMTTPQHIANILFPILMRVGWGHRYTDMGPFRAIRRASLAEMNMRDRAFGWTIEMQIRAVEMGLRILEIPVPYRRRKGKSKISGTVIGSMRAAWWISRTCAGLWLTRHRRQVSAGRSRPSAPPGPNDPR